MDATKTSILSLRLLRTSTLIFLASMWLAHILVILVGVLIESKLLSNFFTCYIRAISNMDLTRSSFVVVSGLSSHTQKVATRNDTWMITEET